MYLCQNKHCLWITTYIKCFQHSFHILMKFPIMIQLNERLNLPVLEGGGRWIKSLISLLTIIFKVNHKTIRTMPLCFYCWTTILLTVLYTVHSIVFCILSKLYRPVFFNVQQYSSFSSLSSYTQQHFIFSATHL